MDRPEPAPPKDLSDLDRDVLRGAVEIYLEHAYPEGGPPESVRRRLVWPEGVPTDALLAGPPFEKAGKDKSTGAAIYALRLGNARYPHMKLQVQPWPNDDKFLLSVNTHDQVAALDPNDPGVAGFHQLQAHNQTLKEAIERAWDDAGLPTFARYLRDYIEARSSAPVDH